MIRLHIRAPGGEGGGQQRLRVEVAPDATLLFLSCTLAARHLAACPPAGFRLSLNRRDAIGAFPPPRSPQTWLKCTQTADPVSAVCQAR